MADTRKADLIRQLDRARSRAAANRAALSEDLQVGDRLKENIEQHRGVWLSGAILTGLAISKLPPRTKKVVVEPKLGFNRTEKAVEKAGLMGLGLTVLKFVFNLVRPYALRWITQRFLGAGPSMRGTRA